MARSIWWSCLAWLLLLAGTTTLAGCGEPLATPEPVYLQVSGSMAMGPVVAGLAAGFHEQTPLVTLEVEDLGTQVGLEDLWGGAADIAMAAWRPEDLESEWKAMSIARDGLAIIVHPSNPVEEIGLLQLQDLFSGKVYEWRAISEGVGEGQIQPVSREPGSGAYSAFEALAMQGQPTTPMAVLVPSPQAVVEYVAEHPGAIGYVSMALVTPDVKALEIEGVLPSPSTASMGTYPLTRELWLVYRENAPEAIRSFLDYVQSPAGQELLGGQFGKIR